MNRNHRLLVLPAIPLALVLALPACPDNISAKITGEGKSYSEEKPNSAFFGTGYSGRMSEASQLRFEGEQLMEEGTIDQSVKKLAKAVQLDPGDPEGHILYARAITKKLYANKSIDEELLQKCLAEWKMIWFHDADQIEQLEAKIQARRLIKIARALDRERKERAEEKLAEETGKARKSKKGLLAEKRKERVKGEIGRAHV